MTMAIKLNPLIWYGAYDVIIDDIIRAQNCYLYDSRGKRYIDLESGVWCTSVGHGNPRILDTITSQFHRISHTGFTYTDGFSAKTAQETVSEMGFEEAKCVYLCSGSEAVEYGIRAAQSLLNKPLLMTMTDSYFGAYGSAHTKHEDEWFCFDWTGCAECPDTMECNQRCDRWAAIPFDRIGGFLFEPGSSSGRIRFPPNKLIRNMADAVKAYNGLIVVNEVTTGIGRTGKWFGHQHYEISPDIIALGKGIGNGYPVSMTILCEEATQRLNGKPVLYGQSHQNDPMSIAVAREVVRIIKVENLIEKSKKISETLFVGLEKIKTNTGKIKDIRGRGLMIAIELRDDVNAAFTTHVHKEMINQGFIVGRRPGINVLRIDPSLTIEFTDIKKFLDTFEYALSHATLT